MPRRDTEIRKNNKKTNPSKVIDINSMKKSLLLKWVKIPDTWVQTAWPMHEASAHLPIIFVFPRSKALPKKPKIRVTINRILRGFTASEMDSNVC